MSERESKETEESGDSISAPWWAGMGVWGAVLCLVGGVVVGVWAFLRMPGSGSNPAVGYYEGAKVVAIGLVVGGSTLLGRVRARRTAAGEKHGTGDETSVVEGD